MIQKILSIVAVVSFLLIGAVTTHAQQPATEPTPTPSIVQYDLAFPGILPDHPLYKVKVLRDKLQILFIADPQKRMAFLLRQADKGMLATAMLVDKHNIPLAHETALKAEHNITFLIDVLRAWGTIPPNDFVERIRTATAKHQEVLASLVPRVQEQERKTFETVIEFSQRNLRSIEDYLIEE